MQKRHEINPIKWKGGISHAKRQTKAERPHALAMIATVVATCSYVLPALIIVVILARLYDRYRPLDIMQGVLKGLHPAVAAMVFAACLKPAGTAFWDGLEHISQANTNVIAVALCIVFFILLQKKKIGSIQAILSSGIIGAVVYGIAEKLM